MADSGTHFMLSVDHSFIDQNEGIIFLYWLWNHKFKGKMYQESGSGQQSHSCQQVSESCLSMEKLDVCNRFGIRKGSEVQRQS